MSNVRVVQGCSLTPEEFEAWSLLQQSEPAFDSPYFRPEFTQAVAAVRDDVHVAILEQDGSPVGFFPFQRGSWEIGRPIGGRLSDFQGVIVPGGVEWDADELLRRVGLSAWDFDHLIASQRPFQPFHERTIGSPYIDLSNGYDAWLAERRQEKSETVTQALRKSRKIEREIGPIRCEFHVPERELLTLLMTWKSQQYANSKLTDVFSFPWTVALLERILTQQDSHFSGALSAMYAGDKLLALHFGMVSGGVLHSWFPAYDRDFARYSPGLVMFLELAKTAAAAGIRRIDLGKGTEDYKQSLMSGSIEVAEGSVVCQPLLRTFRRSWRRTGEWVRANPFLEGGPVKMVRQVREWLEFR